MDGQNTTIHFFAARAATTRLKVARARRLTPHRSGCVATAQRMSLRWGCRRGFSLANRFVLPRSHHIAIRNAGRPNVSEAPLRK